MSARTGRGERAPFLLLPLLQLPFLLLPFLLLSASVARADGFTEYAWPNGRRITDHAILDLSGDGRNDFLLVRGRQMRIFLMKEDGGFDPEDPKHPRANFRSSAILWTHADVTGDGRPEILSLTKNGVYYREWKGTHLSVSRKRLLKTKSILTVAARDEIRKKDFFRDIDGDGTRDLLLPGKGAFFFYRGLPGGGFAALQSLAMSPRVTIRVGSDRPTAQAESRFWYAEPRSGDWNGDGLQDLFVYQAREVIVFLQRKGGRFGPAPDLKMGVAYAGTPPSGRFRLDRELPTEFADLDGDGFSEIVATHMGRAVTQVYSGRADRTDLARPDLLLKLKGITFLQFVEDLNGDGRRDLILVRTDRPGLLDIVKVLITKEVSVEILFFYGREDGTLPRQPDESRELDIPILFSSARKGLNIGTSAVLTLLGDFDGDGRRDLLLRSAEDKLAVFPNEGQRFADEAAFALEVTSMDGYRFLEPTPVDINGDGRDDLVLSYYSWDGKGDRISILLSR